MYTTEPSATNDIKYSQYIYNRTINYKCHKALPVCIQHNYELQATLVNSTMHNSILSHTSK